MRFCGGRLLASTEGEAEGGEEIEIKDEGSEETENIKIAPDPGQPTARQVEEHRQRGHIPYRLWCKWCLMGRGRGAPHSKRGSSTIPIVGLDYFFITSGGVKFRKELEFPEDEAGNRALESKRLTGEIVKCLVIRCSSTKVVLGHVVPCKGPDEDKFVANLVADAVAWMGHTKLIIKADNEVSLQALVIRSLEVIRVKCEKVQNASKEQPPEYDSQHGGRGTAYQRIIQNSEAVPRSAYRQMCPDQPCAHPLAARAHVPVAQRHGRGRRRANIMGARAGGRLDRH